MRLSRDEFYMKLAYAFAERSTCLRGSVGAVLVRDGTHVIGGGYNGAPPGQPHCTEVGCSPGVRPGELPYEGDEEWIRLLERGGCQRTLHAEANAIAFAARYGISTDGSTMYCTHTPCRSCGGLMVSAGILKVKYSKRYRAEWDLKLMEELGIEVSYVGP